MAKGVYMMKGMPAMQGMFMMKGMFTMFISLALGYVLCVIAKKQQGVLKSVGYTLGISIIVITLLYGLSATGPSCPMMDKIGSMCGQMMKCCGMAR